MGAPVSVLMIEDDTVDAFHTLSALQHIGLEEETRVVKDVVEVAHYLRSAAQGPRLILLSFKAPHMEGFNFLRQLQCGLFGAAAQVPVIAFEPDTGRPEIARFCHKLGVVRVLPKPAPLHDLLHTVRALQCGMPPDSR